MRQPADEPLDPFAGARGKATVRKSYCVFADVLGFKDEVRALGSLTLQSRFLARLRSAIRRANANIELTDKCEGDPTPALGAMRSFTDNIVLGFPADDDVDTEASFGITVQEIIPFQLSMVLSGFFLRGGMSLGTLYMGTKIVFGNAIIDAYELEHRRAVYPRIILSKDVVGEVTKHLGYYADDYMPPHEVHVLRDTDGELFLNYLSPTIDSGRVHWGLLASHKRVVERNLKRFAADARIREKYLWVAEYHNAFCGLLSKNEGYSASMLVSRKLLSRSPTTLSGGGRLI